EPAMFGVNVKYVYPFVSAMAGSSIAALISVTSGVKANSIGIGGLPGILSIQSPYWGTFALAMAAAIVIPFVLTIILPKSGLFKKK
ncbi:PTS maltose transporter subunit IIBC, partial [Streptococcus danieliae]|nr:PTS maltose transporter subunit IIBC [Streptococcus danieliae]